MRTDEQAVALARYLAEDLELQAAHARTYDAYYEGEVIPPAAMLDYLEVFGISPQGGPMLRPPTANLCQAGIDAVVERLRVEGFRVDDPQAEQGPQVGAAEPGDPLAARVWRFWLDLDMDVMSSVAHTEAQVKGTAGLLAWPGINGSAVLSVEDATETYLHRRSSPPYDVDAVLKRTTDEWTGQAVSWLYTRRGLLRLTEDTTGASLTVDTAFGDAGLEPLPAALGGRVPAVELAIRPRLKRPPRSGLVAVAPLVDMFNFLLAEMGIAASFGAVPVRTAAGIKFPRLHNADGSVRLDPQGNEMQDPDAVMDIRATRLLMSESPNARFGTLPAADLAGYVNALDKLNEQIRLLNGLPEHYSKGSRSGQSGDTLKAGESNLERLSSRAQVPFGATWRKGLTMGLLLDGQTLGERVLSVRWRDTQTRVLAQEVDAAQKLAAIGVPLQVVLAETMKWDPLTVERAMSLRDSESVRANELLERAQVTVRDNLIDAPVAAAGLGAPPASPGLGGVPGAQPSGGRMPV